MSSRARTVPAAVLACLLTCVLAACTSGGGSPAPTSGASSPVSSSAGGASPTSGPSGPVSSGPTVAAAAKACPWITQSFVKNTIGMRQGRITVLRSGGRVVGCRFYASQAEPYHSSEHLPGPNQPVVEIVRSTYARATDAYNAFVLASRAGTEASSTTIGSGVTGVTYRTTFYPKDKPRDWACGWSVGTTRWRVRLAENDSYQEAVAVARQVARAV